MEPDRRRGRYVLENGERAPLSAFEREERAALIAWFQRRYPTPAARLAYARRAYARWKAALPPSK